MGLVRERTSLSPCVTGREVAYGSSVTVVSPAQVEDTTLLCRQVSLFAVHGMQVMELGVETQKRSFPQLREDVIVVHMPQQPE